MSHRRALTQAFPGIDFELSEREIRWTDGPTHSQVARAIDPLEILNLPELVRVLSEDFRALLADDIELGADPGHEDEDVASRIRRLSRTTSVDGDRCVWSVPA